MTRLFATSALLNRTLDISADNEPLTPQAIMALTGFSKSGELQAPFMNMVEGEGQVVLDAGRALVVALAAKQPGTVNVDTDILNLKHEIASRILRNETHSAKQLVDDFEKAVELVLGQEQARLNALPAPKRSVNQ